MAIGLANACQAGISSSTPQGVQEFDKGVQM